MLYYIPVLYIRVYRFIENAMFLATVLPDIQLEIQYILFDRKYMHSIKIYNMYNMTIKLVNTHIVYFI